MIVERKGTKNNYTFVDLKGNEVKDPGVLEYINKLVIPPNYSDVRIFYQKLGSPKILYQGYDTKMRLQRIYSADWTKKASRRKICELLNFAEQVPHIAAAVKEQMATKAFTKNKMIALILRMVMVCYFRIGNKKYQELYGSFGAMNIQKKHITFGTGNRPATDTPTAYMQVSFNGKKGVFNTCKIYDNELIREVKGVLKHRQPDEMVFLWNNQGVNVPVRAIDINFWLKKFDPVITSKDFRTYDSNIFLIIFLRYQHKPTKLTETARKKVLVQAMKQISEKIHNTPAILKKNYTEAGIVTMYIKEPNRFERYFFDDNTPKRAFVLYLRDYCKDFVSDKKEIIKQGGGGLSV
jgi:DNA topoisomerase-1